MQCGELALKSTQPIISIQGLFSKSERGRLGPQELIEIVVVIVPSCTLLHQLLEQMLIAQVVLFNGHQNLRHRGWLQWLSISCAATTGRSHSGDLNKDTVSIHLRIFRIEH